jgi:dipeptidyl aminopeptidase/acylaminoacyl peptidase
MKMNFRSLSSWMLLAAVICPSLVVTAQNVAPVSAQSKTEASAELSIEDIWRQPNLANITLSRDGKQMAATVPFKGRMNLAVIELDSRKATALTSFTDFDVVSVSWIGNNRLLYSLGQFNSPTGPGQFDGGGLFIIDKDGKNFRRLSQTVRETRAKNEYVYRGLDFYRLIPNNVDEIIASGNMVSADSVDLFRLNLNTGKYTLLTRGRPADLTSRWITDSKLVPRVVSASIRDTLTTVVYYRKDEDSPWYEITRYEANKGTKIIPLAIEANNKTLQVASNVGRDTMGVFKFDPETKTLGELIAAHPRYDMGAAVDGSGVPGVVTDFNEDNKLLGYSVQAAKPEIVWLDEKYASVQRSLDASLPDRINRFRRTPDGKRMIVTSYSDLLPARWYLYDQEAKTIEEIGTSRPWLDGKLTEQRPFVYKTRDGIEIDGYFFLPKNYKPGTKLPTIVHIHGGPFARADTWGSGFGTIEGQLFASRGYAVIVPNFRVTPGLGSKVYYAGFGSYGREMSNDHEDALKWGVEQGFVDSSRVCMSGASYGGYAALQALVRNDSLWKCAIAGLAVTDLKYQLTSRDVDFVENVAAVNYWKSVLGETNLDSQLTKDISPVFNAAKIKKPVFLYAGKDDIRVPIAQIMRMARELERVGNAPKGFVIKEQEGHGFGKLENNVDLYTQVLAFLKENLEK